MENLQGHTYSKGLSFAATGDKGEALSLDCDTRSLDMFFYVPGIIQLVAFNVKITVNSSWKTSKIIFKTSHGFM